MSCTFCFDLECSPDQSEQGGVERDGAITVQRHVHANQALWTGSWKNLGTSEEWNNRARLFHFFFIVLSTQFNVSIGVFIIIY